MFESGISSAPILHTEAEYTTLSSLQTIRPRSVMLIHSADGPVIYHVATRRRTLDCAFVFFAISPCFYKGWDSTIFRQR